MALSRAKKESIIKEFHQKIEKAKAIVFLNFHKTSVAEIAALRRELRQIGGDYQVIKKTFLKKALGAFGFSGKAPRLEGEIAVSTVPDEGLDLAKILAKAVKKLKGLKIVGGILESRYVDGESVNSFASIPPREVLISQVIGMISSPLRQLVGVLKGNQIKLVNLLDQIAKSPRPNK